VRRVGEAGKTLFAEPRRQRSNRLDRAPESWAIAAWRLGARGTTRARSDRRCALVAERAQARSAGALWSGDK